MQNFRTFFYATALALILAGNVRTEPSEDYPYMRHPLYKFAMKYCEDNKLSLYPYHARYIGNTEGIFASAIQTRDGGSLLVATVEGSKEAVVIRFGSDSKVQWRKAFRKAGKPVIEGHSAVEAADGSFYVDMGPFTYPSAGHQLWVLKLDAKGNMIWDVLFRGTGNANNPAADRLALNNRGGINIYGHIYPTLADLKAERSRGWTAEISPDGKVLSDVTAKTDVNYSNDATAEKYPF